MRLKGTRGRARPISELIASFERNERIKTASGQPWSALSKDEQRDEIDSRRLAFLAEVPVNWCPMLGTVLANEEVTAEGRSERGNFPVYKRPLRQWMMRITSYAERLLTDLERVDWPEPIKLMQRNWIGRSEGAWIDFAFGLGTQTQNKIRVFTTRPDTIFGATYMVLSPEHPLVEKLVPLAWDSSAARKGPVPEAWKGLFPNAPKGGFADPPRGGRRLPRLRPLAHRRPALFEGYKDKTGVFTGAYAANPATGSQIPIFIADYVLMGYGTGAIMAVPAHDERDYEFAKAFSLPIRDVVYPRYVLALRHYAQYAYPSGSRAPINWKDDLADFLGLVTTTPQEMSFDTILKDIRGRRMTNQEVDGERRGATRVEWIDAMRDLNVETIDDLRGLFAGASYYRQTGSPYSGSGSSVNSDGPLFA